MSKENITIYDLAKALNLATSTISRALNNSPLVKESTKRKVHKKAKEMGYRPNLLATNLRQQKTFTIGVIMHELRSSFMTSVLSGIEKMATLAGYNLIIAHSSESLKKEKENIENLFTQRVDGIIASLSLEAKNLDHYKLLEERGIPVVFYDRVIKDSQYPKVTINNYQGGYDATRHLIEEGSARIAMVTANLHVNVYSERYRGYLDALNDHHLKPNKDWLIVENDLTEESALEAADAILKIKQEIDGIFVTHDFTAAIIMQALKDAGIRIPEDISIVGFNNDTVCKVVDPQLTTVDYPGSKIGEAAASYLINRIERPESSPEVNNIIISSKLIKRASSLRKEKNTTSTAQRRSRAV